MRKFLLLVLILLVTCGCASRVNFTGIDFSGERQPLDEISAGEAGSIEPAALLEGEKLTFAVSWRRIPVGEIILENHGLVEYAGRETFHLSVRTVSNRFLSAFYRIEDEFHTWLCRDSGYPVKFEKTIREGRYRRFESIEYDHERLEISRRVGNETRVFEIPPGAQNYFSLIYWVRGQELRVGECLEVTVNDGDKNWKVEIDVLERGLINSQPLGMIGAFALEPRASHEGESLKEGTLRVWVSADRRRLPLAFEVNARIFGRAVAVLERAQLPPLPEPAVQADEAGSETWIMGETSIDRGPSLFISPKNSYR